MVRGKGKTEPQVLSESELQTLRDERKEVRETLDALEGKGTEKYGDGTPAQGIDRAALNRQDQRLRDAIDRGSPRKVSGLDKDRMVKESEDIENCLKEGMPSYDEMQNPRKHVGADRKELNWQRKNVHNVIRWREIQRTLRPGDPTAGNIERLRQK